MSNYDFMKNSVIGPFCFRRVIKKTLVSRMRR